MKDILVRESDWIDDNVDGWLNTSTPDIVTLMIGTNDTRIKDISQMSRELSGLIDNITQHLPDTQLLVPQYHPLIQVSLRHEFERQ